MNKVYSTALSALMLLMAFASSALAQQPTAKTWLPEFDPNRHVYVDPQLANHPTFPVNLNGLEGADAIARAEANGLKVYVVATQQGSDLPSGMTKMAVPKLDELITKWGANSTFPHDNYVVILWVRYADDPQHGAVAVNGGNKLRDWGINQDYFNDKVNGPVTKNLQKFMPQDPRGAFSAIARSISADVDKWKAAEASRLANEKFAASLPYYIGSGLFVAALLGYGIFLFVRFRSWKAKLVAAIAEWDPKMQAANKLYLRLSSSYLGFLTSQTDWEQRFKGQTLSSYTKAVGDFADFSVRQKRANELLGEAKKLLAAGRFPGVKVLKQGHELLTSTKVTITGDDLPLETVTLFGGLVQKTEYTPGDLLNAMSELFEATNKALSGIVASLDGARKNRTDIEGLLKKIDEIKPDLTAADLTFDPYNARLEEIRQGQAGFIAILSSDPLAAFSGSEDVERKSEALARDLRRAIEIKNSLSGVQTQIEQSRDKVGTQRQATAAYQYPLVSARPQVEALFRLDEEEGNPDSLILKAQSRLDAAFTLVLAGKLDDADQAKSAAVDHADSASQLVDKVLEAKLYVEQHAAHLQDTLEALSGELPDATAKVSELEAGFLESNITGQRDKLTAAEAEQASTAGGDGRMVALKEHYDAQRYLAARTLLANTQTSLDTARTRLTEITAHLKELKRLRDDARDTVASLMTAKSKLKKLVDDESHTTSRATDDLFTTASEELRTLKQEVGKDKADWPALSPQAHAMVTRLQNITAAVNREKALHAEAVRAVAALNVAVTEAKAYASDRRATNEAWRLYESASGEHTRLASRVRVAKEDWADIKRDAGTAKTTAESAKAQGQLDIEQAAEAEQAIGNARTHINSVRRTRHEYGIFANVSTAERQLQQAESSFASKSYSDATSYANSAYQSANDAARTAERAVEDERERRRPKPDPVSTGVGIGVGVGLGMGGGGGGGQHQTTPRQSEPTRESTPPPPPSRPGGSDYKSTSGGDEY